VAAGRTLYENIRISTDVLWLVLRILTESVSYTFTVSINRRNNEAQAHIKWKTRHKISLDMRIFFTVHGFMLLIDSCCVHLCGSVVWLLRRWSCESSHVSLAFATVYDKFYTRCHQAA